MKMPYFKYENLSDYFMRWTLVYYLLLDFESYFTENVILQYAVKVLISHSTFCVVENKLMQP